MTFGEKLKKLRNDNGMTQDQLAEKIFVTRTRSEERRVGKEC